MTSPPYPTQANHAKNSLQQLKSCLMSHSSNWELLLKNGSLKVSPGPQGIRATFPSDQLRLEQTPLRLHLTRSSWVHLNLVDVLLVCLRLSVCQQTPILVQSLLNRLLKTPGTSLLIRKRALLAMSLDHPELIFEWIQNGQLYFSNSKQRSSLQFLQVLAEAVQLPAFSKLFLNQQVAYLIMESMKTTPFENPLTTLMLACNRLEDPLTTQTHLTFPIYTSKGIDTTPRFSFIDLFLSILQTPLGKYLLADLLNHNSPSQLKLTPLIHSEVERFSIEQQLLSNLTSTIECKPNKKCLYQFSRLSL